ncbi:MAG: M20 metallopeptidase family protein [Chloroflexota bacterium]
MTEYRDLLGAAAPLREWLVGVRRDLHAHPELGFHETRTARVLGEELAKLGVPVRTGVGRTGLVGTVDGRGPGRAVALRADIDALPLPDLKQVPYASRNPGVGHLCGHDAHAAMALGAAALLQARRDTFTGTVKVLFEPAEEMAGVAGPSGAQAMVEDGVLEDPRVDAIFALHVFPEWPAGTVAVRAGSIMAGHAKFRVVILGQEAHPTTPQLGVDAALVAAQVIQALYTLPGRVADPGDSLTLTVGLVGGGKAYNLVPGRVELVGSVRTGNEVRRPTLGEDLERVVRGLCAASGAKYEFEFEPYTFPATCNDPALAARFRDVAGAVLGADRVQWLVGPRLAGESFYAYLEKVPGVYAFLGTGNAAKDAAYSSHHSLFDIDEDVLTIGAALLAAAALDSLAAGGVA